MPSRIHVSIDVEGVGPMDHTAESYQTAADWLLEQLGRSSGSPYPPVRDEAAFTELVDLMTDKLSTAGVEIRWNHQEG
jgi:hypothetical protein